MQTIPKRTYDKNIIIPVKADMFKQMKKIAVQKNTTLSGLLRDEFAIFIKKYKK